MNKDLYLKGRVAFVTGGLTGQGLACCKKIGQSRGKRNCRVVLQGKFDESKGCLPLSK